jgi:hypothetical protein
LNWFKNAPLFPMFIFFLFFSAMQITSLTYDKRINDLTRNMIPIFLIISFIYTFLTPFQWRSKFTYVGSIWCFLSVFLGPLYYFQT